MCYTITLSLASLVVWAGVAVAAVPRVITDIAPVQALVAQVMGDLGTPDLLLDQGANAHSFQLRPSQAGDLAAADLVVWVGPELTPWLQRALDGVGGDAARLGLLAAAGTELRAFGESEDAGPEGEAAHEGEAGHEGEAAHDGETAHAGIDPHAWLDPQNAGVWLGVIAAELGRLDPGNAAVYAANAAAAQAEVAALDAEIAALLAPVRGRPIVVFHDAYGYFAARYGLRVVETVAPGDAALPGVAHLRAVQAALAGGDVCVFPEANHDPKLLAAVAGGEGVRIGAPLDPEGSALPPGPGLYRDLMRGLARGIAACVTGG